MIPAALATLGVCFAALSVLVETPISARILRVEVRRMWRGMLLANVVSYLLLGLLGWAIASSLAKFDALYKPFDALIEAFVAGVFIVASWLAR